MNLERVIAALVPTAIVGGAPVEIDELAYDSRKVTPGSLFFCAVGERSDGHEFAGQAVERGAAALVVERPLALDVPQVVVQDVRDAMGVAAVQFFGDPTRELRVAGITGTNGKTTTAFLLFAILETAGLRPGLLGNVERRIGGEVRPAALNTPEAIDLQRLFREMVDAGHRSCVMEASSHASALGRLDGTRFAALVFTNLTQDHLDFHGTMEDYFGAKRRLFRPDVPAAICLDDPYGRRLVAEFPKSLTFGLSPDADVGPAAIKGVHLRLHGRFNVLNALAALACARLLGVEDDAVRAGLESVEGVPGRFEMIEEGQPFMVLVDYAHTPDSLENVLRAARELADGRLICVFGAGGDRDRAKRPLMGRAVRRLADVMIVTSDNPRTEEPLAIIEEILVGAGEGAEVEPDRRAAIDVALDRARPDDVVVIAGKGHEQGQEIDGRKLPFDDREVARETLRRLRAPA